MDKKLTSFVNTRFGTIRTLMLDGEPWFVGKDVAKALGYVKPENAIANHVDDDDKTTTLIQGSGSNYKSNAVIINESGLYSLILSSKLPTSKEFKHWITSEVLPSLRKTGSYSVNGEEIPTPDADLISALTAAVDRLTEAVNRITDSKNRTEHEKQPEYTQLTFSQLPTAPAKNGKMPRKARRAITKRKIDMLPSQIKTEVDNMIACGEYSDRRIAAYIKKTCPELTISHTAIFSYRKDRFYVDTAE